MKKHLPDLEYEFDDAQNFPVKFAQMTSGQRKPVIWCCTKCNQSWSATVNNRLRGTECPRCTGTFPIPGETDLKTVFPSVSSEWNYTLNPKGPEEYLPYSNKRVSWVCENGHQWEEKINNRTVNGTTCPYCNGSRPIPGTNDLGTLYPWLEKQWDSEANGDLKPSNVFPKSNRRVSWICEQGHKWEAKIYHRTDGQGCPYCAGQKPILGETDLDTLEPAISRQWHPTQNGNRRPSEFTRFSHFGAIWPCDEGHEYTAPIYRRSRGCGCPVCDGKKIVPGVNDLASRSPSLKKEWDWEKNSDAIPETVALHDNRKYHWICQKCGHEWKASPNNRASGKGCPNCAGHCVYPEINSFAAVNPQLIDQWDVDKNFPLTAWEVAAYDNRDYYWLCNHGHSFTASPANRTKGTGCPYCKGKLPVIGINDFATICPTVTTEWHPTKNEHHQPENFLANSHAEVWWMCNEGHEWKQMIYERANGSKCPYCNQRKAISGENDVGTLFPTICKEWHPHRNMERIPALFLPNSGEIVWWQCEQGHEWERSIHDRVNGSTCPYCDKKLPVIGESDIGTLYPNLRKRWDGLKNRKALELYFPESSVRVYWLCENGHSFQAPIREMALRWRCPHYERKRTKR